ncbi:TPA: hypothetical protein PXM79_000987 [Yersinia enterocolitica]|nr:hypothetical protein [Yersinia enterocolitica]
MGNNKNYEGDKEIAAIKIRVTPGDYRLVTPSKYELIPSFFSAKNHGDARFIFTTNFPEDERYIYSIYKRAGDYFLLVDSFQDLNSASKEAIEVLNIYPCLIGSINYQSEYHKNNNLVRNS